MENKIPTAEDFLYEKDILNPNRKITQAMIEFAKLHVEAALKGCLNKYNHASENDYVFGSSEIMNSYSLTNIK